ncbi:PREDICTED: pro-neuregulin-2, membrane-bound isoform-like [Elephantulus edwardii]|uniref:pro-neuregulin-2, membrane-bound isoform-like n=1 Tax=Elephantulus edwardii TaxID=28737 RepID=UPI0003F0C8C4|nr:PREDICTED: pro-neuregulin-2, membrane-bound isoform-like [Elephantulus edwardii]
MPGCSLEEDGTHLLCCALPSQPATHLPLGIQRRLTGPRLLKRHLSLPSKISAAHSDCSLFAAGPPIAATRATEREEARREQKTVEGKLCGPARRPGWGEAAPGECAPQVNRLERSGALPLPPWPPCDFQARNSASRALSLALSPSRLLAASAAAAASLHTKDCYPLSSSSTSTSSSSDSSPDSRVLVRRRRPGEPVTLSNRGAARSWPPLLPLLLLWTAALAPGAAAGDEAAPAGASVCYSSPPSVGSVQELAQRAAVVIEGKVHPPPRQQGALEKKAAAAGEAGAWGGERQPAAAGPGLQELPTEDPLPFANGTLPSWPSVPAPSASDPGEEAPYLVKVHQVWAVKAGGLKKDSLLTVRLGAWGHPAFPSCGRLKEDSRYIFFMEPDANSSSRAPAAFRASFPPLETGRNLKKEVSRVLCKRCGKFLAPRGALGQGGESAGRARRAHWWGAAGTEGSSGPLAPADIPGAASFGWC